MEERRDGGVLTLFGVRRQVDEIGRITIPSEFRALLKLHPRSGVAYSGIGIPGFGQGVFVFATNEKVESGRRIDYLGRFTIPFRMCNTYMIEKRKWVELVPICHEELGYGLFVHRVNSDCVVEDTEA